MEAALGSIADLTGQVFGDRSDPLLVSVRSGARASMPGMMDTVLNLGLNDETVNALAQSADPRFAWDSYRRFIQMYGNVVLGVEHHEFESILELEREKRGAAQDTDLDAEALQGHRRPLQEARGRKRSTRRSRRIRTTSSGAPSARCSGRG